MPNIKSSAKRDQIAKARNAKNRANKTALKTALKKYDAAVADGSRAAAEAPFHDAVRSVDRAVTKGLMHKNAAARKKSQLAHSFNALAD
ncbi:MAG: 30S ribosomal protein S20 [Eubacteriales bacterium]|nr:30S ribosomal protein S20 [Eubacteriales bacterium]